MEFLAIYRDFVSFDKLWLAIAIVAFIVKCFTKEYVSFSIGIGGIITFVVSHTIFINQNLYQIITFFVITLFFALMLQPYAIQKNDERRRQEAREKNVPFFGREATVVEAVDNMNATGKIVIDGVEHVARSATGIVNLEGQTVRVVDHDGSILLVV